MSKRKIDFIRKSGRIAKKTKQQEEEEEEAVEDLPLIAKARHILNIQQANKRNVAQQYEPILFQVEYECNGSLQFAWWPPLGDVELPMKVLNTLYETLCFKKHATNDRHEHRLLVDALVYSLTREAAAGGGSVNVKRKEESTALLTQYFGTNELGQMKRVIYPDQEDEEKPSSRFLSFYSLPAQVSCYVWRGFRCP